MSRFAPGQSGNPGGKTKKKVRAVVGGIEGEYTEFEIFAPLLGKSVEFLLQVLEDKGASSKDRMKAAIYIADRIFGRPRQAIELSGEDGDPVKLDANHVFGNFSEALERAAAAIAGGASGTIKVADNREG